ncbi:MAG: hypothetical protein MK078_15260 [Crocinitomicaceae bacterium]|nr:hypothetical protein [Crocinitomicaceae bacterium]
MKNVGDKMHNELWIPAEDLEDFNTNIIGKIQVVNAFFGDKFSVKENTIVESYYKIYT